MTDKAKKASELFLMGYGCSQSILGAFADEAGIDQKTAMKIASGFGGGMGRMREVCGAMTGSFMVLGLIYGFDQPSAAKKAQIYEHIKAVADEFKKQSNTIICRELLQNVKITVGSVPEERTDDYYKRRPCLAHIIRAAEILEDYINTHPKENI